jgi:hypothetical protein
MKISESRKYKIRNTKIFWVLVIIGLLGGFSLGIPGIHYLQQISFESKMKILDAQGLDTSGNGYYDLIYLNVSVPSQGVSIEDLVVQIKEDRYIWKLNETNQKVLKEGRHDLTIVSVLRQEELVSGTEAGIALIYTLLGKLELKYATYYLQLPFINAKVPIVFGLYTDFIAPQGWVFREYRLELLDKLYNGLFKLSRKYPIDVVLLNDQTVLDFMKKNANSNNWLLITSDVLHKNLHSDPIARDGPLVDYIDKGGNVGFIGGKPYYFAYDDNQNLIIRKRSLEFAFDRFVAGTPPLFKSSDSVFKYTDLGTTVFDKTDETFFSHYAMSTSVTDYYNFPTLAFGESWNGDLYDPVLTKLPNGAELLFSYTRLIDSSEIVDSLVDDTLKLLEYIINTNIIDHLEFDVIREFNLIENERTDALSILHYQKYSYFKIKDVKLIRALSGQQMNITWDRFELFDTSIEENYKIIEIVFPEGFINGQPYNISIGFDYKNDGVIDHYESIRYTPKLSEQTTLDVGVLLDLEIEPIDQINKKLQLLNNIVTAENDKRFDFIGGAILNLIINNLLIKDIIILTSSHPTINPINFNKYISVGGNVISFDNIVGYSQYGITKQITLNNANEIATMLGMPSKGILFTNLNFAVSSWGQLFYQEYSINNYHISIDLFLSGFDNIIPLYQFDDLISSFILTINQGSYSFLFSDNFIGESPLEIVKSLLSNDNQTFKNEFSVSLTHSYDLINDNRPNVIELSIHNSYRTIKYIDTISVNGVSIYIDNSMLIPGFNFLNLVLPKSLEVNNEDDIFINFTTTSSEVFSDVFSQTLIQKEYVIYFDRHLKFIESSRIGNLIQLSGEIILNTELILLLFQNNITTTIINLNELLSNDIISDNNDLLIPWIQSGGIFYHFGYSFGEFSSNYTYISVYNESFISSYFGINPYLPDKYRFSNSSLIEPGWLSIKSINATKLIEIGYEIEFFGGLENQADFIKIRGSGIGGIDFKLGSLILASIWDISLIITQLGLIIEKTIGDSL